MISLCIPTKARPSIFKRMCLSALDNAFDPNDIEFVSYRENIDKSVYEYFGNHQEIIGDGGAISRKVNECQAIATGDIYMMISDDFVFETKEWDKAVEEVFNEYPDKIVMVWPDDKCYRSSFGQSMFLHRNWVETVGYFAAPYFVAQFIDNWWNDVANIINRKHFLRHTVVKHYCVADDDTHREHMKMNKEFNSKALYRSPEMQIKREEDAKKLQEFIDNWGNDNE